MSENRTLAHCATCGATWCSEEGGQERDCADPDDTLVCPACGSKNMEENFVPNFQVVRCRDCGYEL